MAVLRRRCVFVGSGACDADADRRAILLAGGPLEAGHRVPEEPFLSRGAAQGGPGAVHSRQSYRDPALRAQLARRGGSRHWCAYQIFAPRYWRMGLTWTLASQFAVISMGNTYAPSRLI